MRTLSFTAARLHFVASRQLSSSRASYTILFFIGFTHRDTHHPYQINNHLPKVALTPIFYTMILPWRSRTSKKVYSHEDQARANVVQALTSRGPKRVFLLLLLLLLFVLRIQRSWSSSGGFSVKDYIDMLDHSHIASAQSRERADAGLTSLDSSHSKTRTLAKISMCYGDPPLVYARALARQRLHNDMHGYDMFLLREKLLSRLWSKPAYILGVMLKEMEKPAEERLQWLL